MKREISIITVSLLSGLLLGWLIFYKPSTQAEESQNHQHDKNTEIWSCSMHPQIRLEQPGKCPICAMDLIPLRQNSSDNTDPKAIRLTKEAAQLANVMTTVVTTHPPQKEVRLYGKVAVDERLKQSQVAFFAGRIEKLFVTFTGEAIQKGAPLATIYSPELITAQQELIEAAASKMAQPAIYEAAREKLLQWKLSDKQILEIEKSGKTEANMTVYATCSGIVTAKKVNTGDYIGQGTVLFEIADLSQLWVQFDAYETDLQYLQKGDKIDFTLQALPGENFSATIQFIDQTLDPVTRIARVRVATNNLHGKLKPEMFATGLVRARVEQYKDHLTIPRSAVLWTGKRSVVYVKTPGNEPVFTMREIGLGPLLGNNFVVTEGLNEGEELVTEGVFSVDAAAQLEGKPSMMNGEAVDAATLTTSTTGLSQQLNEDAQLLSYSFKVAGNCDMCKDRIEQCAKTIPGVLAASWNSSDKILHIKASATFQDPDLILKKIAEVGHDTEKFRAPDEVYNKLPECCLYRKK